MNVSFVENSSFLKPLWQGTKNVANDYLHFTFGVEQSDVFSKALKTSIRGTKNAAGKWEGGEGFHNLGTNFKNAWETSKETVGNKSFGALIKESFGNVPNEFKTLFANETRLLGRTKGAFGILGKRMPLIGNIVMLGMEIPNIWNAFTNPKGGIGTGIVESTKAGVKLGAFAAGAAIGQAFIPIPFVGGLIGGMVGGFIADKMLGKSFSEKHEEENEKQAKGTLVPNSIPTTKAQVAAAQNAVSPLNNNALAYNDFASNPFATNSFEDDIYYKQAMATLAGQGAGQTSKSKA